MKRGAAQLRAMAFVLAVLASLAGMDTLPADAQNERPLQGRTLRIASVGGYPPIHFLTDDRQSVQGFDIDIVRALCTDLGARCEILKQEWEDLAPGLQARQFDAVVASMAETDERRQQVDFSDPYYRAPAKFLRVRGSGIDVSDGALRGRRIGVESNTVAVAFLRDRFGAIAQINEYGKYKDAAADMLAGRLDLVFGYSIALEKLLFKNDDAPRLEFVGPDYEMPDWPGISIVVRKGDSALREAFNTAIRNIWNDGTYRSIQSRYFSYDVYPDGGTRPAADASAAVEDSGAAATGIVGTWSGIVDQPDYGEYPVTLHITSPDSGSIDYPTLDCSTSLSGGSAGSSYRFQERLTHGPCADGGTIEVTLSGSDAMHWTWFFPDGRRGASGTLMRSTSPGNTASIVGTWTGLVDQPDYGQFPVTIQMTSTTAGTTEYPTLNCDGALAGGGGGGKFTFRQSLTRGFGSCVEGATIEMVMSGANNLAAEWHHPAMPKGAAAQLSRVTPAVAASDEAPAATATAEGSSAVGASGVSAVAEAQRLLAQLGLDAGPADGVAGSKTRTAIATHQRKLGLPADGQVSASLLASLRTAVAQGEALASTETKAPAPAGNNERTRAQDPTAALLQALLEFRAAVAGAFDRRLDAACHAFWDAHVVETGPGPADLLQATLATGGQLEAAERGRAQFDAAQTGLEVVALAVSDVTGDRLARARTMTDVAALYSTAEDYELAVRLYLLGLRDLASPLRLDGAVAGSAPQDKQAWGVGALRQAVLSRVDELIDGLQRGEWRPAVALENASGQIRERTAAMAKGKAGGLDDLRRQIAAMAAADGPLTLTVSTAPDASGAAALRIGYALHDGRLLSQEPVTLGTPGAPLPAAWSKTFATTARAQTAELAYAMLWTLPAELAEIARAITETETYLRGKEVEAIFVAAPVAPPPSEVEPAAGPAPTAQAASVASAASAPSIQITLKDGSVHRAVSAAGEVAYATAFGQLTIAAKDIVAFGEQGLQLADGTLLRGRFVGGELQLDTGSDRQAIAVGDIAAIAAITPASPPVAPSQ